MSMTKSTYARGVGTNLRRGWVAETRMNADNYTQDASIYRPSLIGNETEVEFCSIPLEELVS